MANTFMKSLGTIAGALAQGVIEGMTIVNQLSEEQLAAELKAVEELAEFDKEVAKLTHLNSKLSITTDFTGRYNIDKQQDLVVKAIKSKTAEPTSLSMDALMKQEAILETLIKEEKDFSRRYDLHQALDNIRIKIVKA